MASKEFKKYLMREIELYVQEIKDGCLDCRDMNGLLCDDHRLLIMELISNPRRCIKVSPPLIKSGG